MGVLGILISFTFVCLEIVFSKDIVTLVDHKDFKRHVKTHNNVAVLFCSSSADCKSANFYTTAALDMKGLAVLATCICSGETKRLCKKLKVHPDPITIHHYANGEFNTVYNRPMKLRNFINFLKDPTGEPTWEDDGTAPDVLHLNSPQILQSTFQRPQALFVLFYASWCGHCKRMKPEFAALATKALKHKIADTLIAACDASKEDMTHVRQALNITAFPTVLYFGSDKRSIRPFKGPYTVDAMWQIIMNPDSAIPTEYKEEDSEETVSSWDEDSYIVQLNDDTFDSYISEHSSVYVAFYAPWCGHCKRLRLEWAAAAEALQDSEAFLAAVDSTSNQDLATRFNIQGYPTLKYFIDGKEAPYTADYRQRDKIVEFLRNPQAPKPEPKEVLWHEDPSSNVVHLSSETFIPTLKRKKYSLVMFYAPWCGHCKATKPEFESAAAVVIKSHTKAILAAIDCTAHEGICEQNNISGYPTLKTFNYGKRPSDYRGPRNEAGFIQHFATLFSEHTEL